MNELKEEKINLERVVQTKTTYKSASILILFHENKIRTRCCALQIKINMNLTLLSTFFYYYNSNLLQRKKFKFSIFFANN